MERLYNLIINNFVMNLEKFFEKIGDLFTSVGAIIFVMTMVIIAMIFHTQTLFYRYLPVDMPEFSKAASSIVLAVGFEFTVLLTTTNSQYVKGKWAALIFAITTFFISTFFFEAFDFSQKPVIVCFRFFASFIIAFVNYIYSELFTMKWHRFKMQKSMKEELEKSLAENSLLGSQLKESKAKIAILDTELKNSLVKLQNLEKQEKARLKVLTCPYCNEVFKTEARLRGHKGRCGQNPKKISINIKANGNE